MLLQNMQDEFAKAILSEDKLSFISPDANLEIYKYNFLSNLTQTLRDTYPLICKIVGDEYFCFIAAEYIQHYPSRSGNLAEYGQYFADFINHYPALNDYVYLSEVARFEWICHNVSIASNAPVIDISLALFIKPDQYPHLYFTLHPASEIVAFRYPILDIIDLCKNISDVPVNIDKGGVNLLIIRREFDIMLVTLSLADYYFLQALQSGESVSYALKQALDVNPEFNLEANLARWIEDKTLVDFYL